MPITARQVNEASGGSEANVARDRTARTGGTARPGMEPANSYRKMSTKSAGPSSKSESKSGKSWSRSGARNQKERAGR